MVNEELISSIVSSLGLLNIDDKELDNAWLRSAQTIIITRYLQVNHFPEFDTETMLDYLAYLQLDLSDKDCLTLAKTMIDLQDVPPIDFTEESSSLIHDDTPLVVKMSNILLTGGRVYSERNAWMQRCLHTVISSQTEDQEIPKLFLKITSQYWTIF